MTTRHRWQPPDFSHPDSGRLGQIKAGFSDLFPEDPYGDLAIKISRYWVSKLKEAWDDTQSHWDDSARRKFEEEFLRPLIPQTQLALAAIRQMAEAFADAEKALEDNMMD